MSRLDTDTETSVLLNDLRRRFEGGAAEYDPADVTRLLQLHLPIVEHRRVLDRDTLLVLGGRGAGKTQLFKVLNALEDPDSLAVFDAPRIATAARRVAYARGFTTIGRDFPHTDVIESLRRKKALEDAGDFWLGLLTGVLLRRAETRGAVTAQLGQPLASTFVESLTTPSRWLAEVQSRVEPIHRAVDDADNALERQGTTLTVTYDDLDLLVAKLPDAYSLIRDLLAFWLKGQRRWSHIRCKVFLRTDIFAAEELAFTDSSKLRPLSVTLRWNADNLYRLALKRLLDGEHQSEWEAYLRRRIPTSKFRRLDPWGVVPDTKEPDHRAFMKLLIGQYMGTDKRRGDSYRWVLNHLQDSRGDISPRSFLTLFGFAAKRQVDEAPAENLLAPVQVSGALMDVSQHRLQELREEYKWIDALAGDLKGNTVPMDRAEFRKCCRTIDWLQFPEPVRGNKDRMIDYLISLGILRETGDRRIHVPDIYLFGFGLKRKGGIRRPKV